MKKVILRIEGMSCSACQNTVEKYLNKQDGVTASVNLVMAQALIEYNEEKVTIDDLNRFIEESGYKSLGVYNEKKETKKDNSKIYLIVFSLITILLMYISMGHMIGLPVIPFLDIEKYPKNYGITLFILTIPYIIYGFDILKSGITKMIHKSPNMDSLVSIGVLSSLFYSAMNLILVLKGNNILVHSLYFESSATILFFMKLGRFIDLKSKQKTKEAIKELVTITPQTALLKRKTSEEEVTIDCVKKNDILICKPGMKIAVDGIIVEGMAHIDEAFITGESKASKKEKGDKVVAGSINIDGYIEYKAERIGPESTISEIVRLVIEASNTKAPIGRIADKVSGYFVPSIIFIAILTFLGYLFLHHPLNESIISFVTVLVVACPCALGLATPLAIIVSEGHLAKLGILVKSSETLENAYKIDTIIFDKTGTLTYGTPKISTIKNDSSYSDTEFLQMISSIENNSTHPISLAFQTWIKENKKKVDKIDKFEMIPGAGIKGIYNNKTITIGNDKLLKQMEISNIYEQEAEKLLREGENIIYVIEENQLIGMIGVKDIIRKEAKNTIKKLINMKKDIIMLSGDNEITANQIAKSLGITKVKANLLPKEKEKYIKELKRKNHKIMMVGDGINDAPSLASSDIGVSISSGTDIAASSSDVILIQNDLNKLANLFKISEKTIKIIKENLFWAFFYNICMIPIAIGLLKPIHIWINPMIASIAMVVSSLTVIMNSLRLRK